MQELLQKKNFLENYYNAIIILIILAADKKVFQFENQ